MHKTYEASSNKKAADFSGPFQMIKIIALGMRVVEYFHRFLVLRFAVFAACLNAASVGAPLSPFFLIFFPAFLLA